MKQTNPTNSTKWPRHCAITRTLLSAVVFLALACLALPAMARNTGDGKTKSGADKSAVQEDSVVTEQAFVATPEVAPQLKSSHVRTALQDKSPIVDEILAQNGLAPGDFHMLMVVFKYPGDIHVFGKNVRDNEYREIASYPICYFSGFLGPKRQEGDEQTPEGFYHISKMNPYSAYYLSLKVSYPNKSDRILSTNPKHPGGQILIHGDCVSIGCMAMTDEVIQEIYLYALYATNNGQKDIPLYIFPFEMTDLNMAFYLSQQRYHGQAEFWKNLQEGYDQFMFNHEALDYTVDKAGRYVFHYPGKRELKL